MSTFGKEASRFNMLRTTRKARPISDLNSPSDSCDTRNVRYGLFG